MEKPSLSNESLFLADDIIIDILSRLPAKDVLRYRCVCRQWKDLTLTRDFIDLHSRLSYPMLLKDDHGMCLLDECWETAQTRSMINKICQHSQRGDRCWETAQTRSRIHKVYQHSQSDRLICLNGLIVAKGGRIHKGGLIIYNPIYRNVVKINAPVKPFKSKVYGVFFHPVLKEYCTLWRITRSFYPWNVQYKILNLESNPQWRDIKNPCNENARISGIHPILIDTYLYWMIGPSGNCNIMEYDIKNEEFRVIPCPGPVTKRHCYDVNMIDIDGVVSLVQFLRSTELVEINIWTLKDHGELLWTCCKYSDVYPGYGVSEAVAYWNGELVIQLRWTDFCRILVCNLKQGTFRKFGPLYNYDMKLLSCDESCFFKELEVQYMYCGRG